MPRGIYERTKPVGFLKPAHNYVVVAGGRNYYMGRNTREAWATYQRIIKPVKRQPAIASGWVALIICDGSIIGEKYVP